MYRLQFSKEARKDIVALKKSGNWVVLKKLDYLLREIVLTPTTGTGKPKRLRHGYVGCWSRRITSKHRLVYQIIEHKVIIIILSVEGHYDDK